MTSVQTFRAQTGNVDKRDYDHAVDMGRADAELSRQQNMRRRDPDDLMPADRRSTGSRGPQRKRAPTPNRNAGRKSGSGAWRRSRTRSSSRTRGPRE